MSVPNICLNCEEEGRNSLKTLKQQQKKKVVETLEDVTNQDHTEEEHQLME